MFGYYQPYVRTDEPLVAPRLARSRNQIREGMIVSRSGTEYPRAPPLDAAALQERELVWSRLPETIYQGTISCLSVAACLQLDSALTNR